MALHEGTGGPVDALLRDLYGSLSEEMRFEQPLHRVGALFGSSISGLHSEDFGTHRGRLMLIGDLSAEEYLELSDDYSSRWTGHNLWMERSLEGFLTQGFQFGDAVVSESELFASSYYQHFLKPLDIRHGMGIPIWSDGRLNMAVASFHRGHGERCFDANDVALIEQVRPHLVNAYAIYRRLAHLEDTTASLRACFERVPLGMLLLDGGGRLLESNAAADHLLSAGTIRRTQDGRLQFAAARVQHAFSDAVRQLADPVAPSQSLPFEGARPLRRFVLHLCGIPPDTLSGLPPRTRILAFVAELQPGHAAKLAAGIVRQVLRLSAAETRVALALREQGNAEPVAQMLGMTLNTVRSHLRSIHAKLGIRRNGDLLQILERLLGSAPES